MKILCIYIDESVAWASQDKYSLNLRLANLMLSNVAYHMLDVILWTNVRKVLALEESL